jgi:ornithine cyclodeaminase/alanine dehydrogenase-like protein (mu-crystallin family)
MTVLVLSDADVRGLLDMESCIEAMEQVLAALARDELSMPLRTMFRPHADGLFGLMPAHRGGDAPLFSLKEIVVIPSNSARGLDPHQGAVLLHDGETGVLRAALNASAITEIRTAAVSALATKLLARRGARRVAILGAGVQARSHAHAMHTLIDDPELRIWSRTPEHAEALALEAHAVVCGTAEEALDGAEIICACTAAREPVIRRAWLRPGAHVNAVGSSSPTARELDGDLVAAASLFVDRRESALNEAGDYLLAVEEHAIGPDHILAELGEVLVGAHPGRRRDDELTVFKSLGLAVEDLAAAALCVERALERGVGTEVPF